MGITLVGSKIPYLKGKEYSKTFLQKRDFEDFNC